MRWPTKIDLFSMRFAACSKGTGASCDSSAEGAVRQGRSLGRYINATSFFSIAKNHLTASEFGASLKQY
jgi:hypothetical protein